MSTCQSRLLDAGISPEETAAQCKAVIFAGVDLTAVMVEAPGKKLNVASGKRITQRDCQTWIVESANQLFKDYIFTAEVAVYLHKIKQ
ncbi:hypothetical protein N7495_002403 [Penicillium taxi]|uniref:uncharacterized protein n=1 Tax=Penicillium taxi TaxID=168475 RepID=UPI002544EB0F|nr:uncharacterized protein N7495_002403 [Penicillium taxi]KAJ5901875.1 hypothetical protein N7495_002403 [Penicillium taxi]